MGRYRSFSYLVPGEDYVEIDHVSGVENPSEFPNILRWLAAHGYSEQIAKLAGGNLLRALRDVWV